MAVVPWAGASIVAANGFEGGADGVGVTALNSDDNGTGTAFNSVQVTGTSTITYQAAGAIESVAAVFTRGGGTCQVRWDAAALGTMSGLDCGAIYVKFLTLPSAYASFLLRQQTDGGTASFRLKISSLGNIRLTDQTDVAIFSSTTNPLVVNTWYRIEWQINHTTSAYVVEWFSLHLTTPINRFTGTAGAGVFGASATQITAGAIQTPDYQVQVQAFGVGTAKLGPMQHDSSPPSVAAIAAKNAQVGGTQTFTAVGTDPEGGTLTYNWAIVSYPGSTSPTLTNSTSATVTVGNLTTDGDVVLSVIPTSSVGGPGGPTTTTLYVAKAPGSPVYPDAIITNNGGWVQGGTATSLVDGLTDAGEWIMTLNGPSGASILIGLPPLTSTDVAIDFYADLVQADGVTAAAPGSTGTILAQLFDGATAKSAQVSATLSPTEVHVFLTLTPAENAAYTVRNDPRILLTASASA